MKFRALAKGVDEQIFWKYVISGNNSGMFQITLKLSKYLSIMVVQANNYVNIKHHDNKSNWKHQKL